MADAITHWNDVLLEVVRQVGGFPGPVARGGAMVHAAMYDAVNSIAPSTHEPYAVSVPAAPTASIDAAIAHAAHDTLRAAFPTTTVPLATRLSEALAALPAGSDIPGGQAVGTAAAAAMIALRRGDGADDNTPYTNGIEPGDWRPTSSGPAGTPNWGNLRPFVMPFGQSFRPSRPGGFVTKPEMLQSTEYAAQFNEVKTLGRFDSAVRTPEQTEIARFWANDLDGTSKPPGQLFTITKIVAELRGLDVVQNARLFALVALAMGDAAIVAWDAKYDTSLDLWRPESAITLASSDANAATVQDDGWLPLSNDPAKGHFTPPFPAYISGHSTLGAVHAAIMRRFFGTDNVTFTATTEDPNLPAGVQRTFNSFTEAARENARSRIYNGVHYQWDADNGFLSGSALGEFVFANVLRPIGNFPAPQPAPSSGRDDKAAGRLYVMSNQATGNSVTVFARAADGSLTQKQTFPTGGLGGGSLAAPNDPLTSQGSLILSKDQRFLFAVDAGSDEVSVLAVDGDNLIAVDRVSSGGTFPVSVTVRDNLLYVLNTGDATGHSNVTGFTVGSDGKLTALTGSTQQLIGGAGASPAQVAFSPDGTRLVVTERLSEVIDVLPVGPDGRAGALVKTDSSGSGPFGFAFAGNDVVIVSELFASATSSYRLGSDGALTVISGSLDTAEEGACWVALNSTTDPRFAYVSNAVSGSITGYNIGANGELSRLTIDGHTAVTVDQHAALDSAVSGDEQFLYILTAGFDEQAENPMNDPMSINAYRIEQDGKLTAVHGPGGLVPAIEGLAPGTQGIAAT
ncbi:MAG TPA: beta-propeller fold lactonase family protein [Solirubrobacteraceae bacterium]|jgi:6-phosphogluconolactonase (cycloisomerase 2 family)|nr:beta-propeller fold lactonase family protein [Solirubrobacteraceae bacterium]